MTLARRPVGSGAGMQARSATRGWRISTASTLIGATVKGWAPSLRNPTRGWAQVVALCEQSLMPVPVMRVGHVRMGMASRGVLVPMADRRAPLELRAPAAVATARRRLPRPHRATRPFRTLLRLRRTAEPAACSHRTAQRPATRARRRVERAEGRAVQRSQCASHHADGCGAAVVTVVAMRSPAAARR